MFTRGNLDILRALSTEAFLEGVFSTCRWTSDPEVDSLRFHVVSFWCPAHRDMVPVVLCLLATMNFEVTLRQRERTRYRLDDPYCLPSAHSSDFVFCFFSLANSLSRRQRHCVSPLCILTLTPSARVLICLYILSPLNKTQRTQHTQHTQTNKQTNKQTKQNKTKQNKTKQNKTKQNKTKQNKTKQTNKQQQAITSKQTSNSKQ